MHTQYFHIFKDAAGRIRPLNGGSSEGEAMQVLSKALLSEFSSLYNDIEYYDEMQYINTNIYVCNPCTKEFNYHSINLLHYLDDWRVSQKEAEYCAEQEWLDHQRFETRKVRV